MEKKFVEFLGCFPGASETLTFVEGQYRKESVIVVVLRSSSIVFRFPPLLSSHFSSEAETIGIKCEVYD